MTTRRKKYVTHKYFERIDNVVIGHCKVKIRNASIGERPKGFTRSRFVYKIEDVTCKNCLKSYKI